MLKNPFKISVSRTGGGWLAKFN